MHTIQRGAPKWTISGHATLLSKAYATTMSVRLSVCHTHKSMPKKFKISKYPLHHTILYQTIAQKGASSFLRPKFAILNLGVHPNECIKERHPRQ